jgi:hypothetical protein
MSSFLLYSTSVFPANAPIISSISAGISETLSVNFIPPSSNGGQIVINYQYSLDDGESWTSLSPESASSPIIITGLVDDVLYPIKIRAVYEEGFGPSSNTVNATPRFINFVPQITSIVSGNQQLSVNFTAELNEESPTTNYQYSIDGGSSWITRSPASTSSPIIITGLNNGTTYNVLIRPITPFGFGDQSSAVSATAGTVPSTPTAPIVNNANIGRLSVSWTAPSSEGFAITGYTLQRRLGSGSWSTVYTGTASSFSDTSVVKGSSYQYRVLATNFIGNSDYSNESAASTVQGVVATGGVESTTGNYRVHRFNSGSTFSVTNGGNVEYLVVGGGGGGSGGAGGIFGSGGNGGQVLSGNTNVLAQSYSIVIGNGGSGGPYNSGSGGTGQSSSALGISASGGTGPPNNATDGTTSFGVLNGINGTGSSGSGRTGTASTITGTTIRVGGGGGRANVSPPSTNVDGGGRGGYAGDPNNFNAQPENLGLPGDPNTGGGGGGSYNSSNPGRNGGSGLVIIRYLIQ